MTMLDGALPHNTALREYERQQAAYASWDALVERCKEEIKADIAKGIPVRCNGYVASPNDFHCYVSERPEADMHLLAFMAGHLSADDYRKWLDARLDEYADRHAFTRAEFVAEVV
jgi:hypothetical protein